MEDNIDERRTSDVDFYSPDVSLYAYNFPEGVELEHIPNVRDQDFLAMTFNSYSRLGTLQLDNHCQAVLAYYSNGPILALERQKYDVKTRKHLNKYGLKIFLTEPLCSYIDGDNKGNLFYHNFNFGFYSEFYNEGNDPKKFRAKELDSIFKHVRENALTNVTVSTCDFEVDIHYPLYKNYMKLTCEDLFLRDIRIYDNISMEPKGKITKKFICPTWRYTTSRWLLASLMSEMDCYLSWYFAVAPNFLEATTWATSEEFKKYAPDLLPRVNKATKDLMRKSPICLDIPAEAATLLREHAAHNYPKHLASEKLNEGMNPIAINEAHQPLDKLYNHTFVSVQIESRFAQPTGNWSEKLIQAVQYKTPFILVAPPHTLRYLKTFGYETFDKWWDESYDEEENHMIRFKKIVEVIDYIQSLSYTKLNKIIKEMQPILEHNFMQAIDNTQTGTLSASPDPSKAVSISWGSEWAKNEF